MILSSPRTEKKMQNWNRIILLWKRRSWCQFGNMQFSNHSCWPIKHQNLDFEDSHFNFMNFLCIVKVFHFAIFLFQFDDWNDWNSFLKSRKTFGGFKKLWNGRFLIKKSWNWNENLQSSRFRFFICQQEWIENCMFPNWHHDLLFRLSLFHMLLYQMHFLLLLLLR